MPRKTPTPRKALTFREAIRLENSQVNALAKIASGNTTAKGDQGEDLIIHAINKRLGSSFRAAKGEIIDAAGNATPELDCIIYDSSVCAVVSDTWSGRKLVRAESVVMTIQIRASLDIDYLKKMQASHFGMVDMPRFYRETHNLKLIRGGRNEEATARLLAMGAPMKWPEVDVPQVVSCVLGYSARFDLERAWPYLNEVGTDYICVLDQFLIGSRNPGFPDNPMQAQVFETGEDSFLAFLGVIELALEQYAYSRQWVLPDWRKYYERPRTEPLETVESVKKASAKKGTSKKSVAKKGHSKKSVAKKGPSRKGAKTGPSKKSVGKTPNPNP